MNEWSFRIINTLNKQYTKKLETQNDPKHNVKHTTQSFPAQKKPNQYGHKALTTSQYISTDYDLIPLIYSSLTPHIYSITISSSALLLLLLLSFSVFVLSIVFDESFCVGSITISSESSDVPSDASDAEITQ